MVRPLRVGVSRVYPFRFRPVSEVFLAGDIGQCRSHPQQARFPKENNGIGDREEQAEGYYPCCKKSIYRWEEGVIQSDGICFLLFIFLRCFST